MKQKHFTEAQIAFALRQAESGTPVTEVIRKMRITEAMFYREQFPLLGACPSNSFMQV